MNTTFVQNHQLQLLFELDSAINRIQDMDLLLEEVLRGARMTVNADAGSIYLIEKDQLHIKYSQNETLEKLLPLGDKLLYSIFSVNIDNKTISGYCALTGKPLMIPDAYHIPSTAPYSFNPQFDRLSHYETHSILALPLTLNTGTVIGVLQLINARDVEGRIRPFTDEDELLASHFASGAAMALQRARLTRTILERMMRMAEFRDPKETAPHVNRVSGYATELYRRWALKNGVSNKESNRTADVFRMAAMLHDVGKVGIADAILKKPGQLTDEEYEEMKTHTTLGYTLFGDAQSDFDVMAAEVAWTHHENWDGSGYPRGLQGEEIPLWGRITALADVYDALSCHRAYKPAWKEDEVLAEIRRLTGVKFDPALVVIFFEALPALRQIFQRYPDF